MIIKKRKTGYDDKKKQIYLFDMPPVWLDEWKGMPDFKQEDLMPRQTVKVHFRNSQDRKAFSELVKQPLTNKTQYIWYPKAEKSSTFLIQQKTNELINPKYPVYIISKGRWESRLTSKALEKIGVPYHIVIEPQEYEQYSKVIDSNKILILPFSNLGQGSIPARNWVWEHSISIGVKRHWILDDNIRTFYRLNNNEKIRVANGNIFAYCEIFADKYTNVAICGMHYESLTPRKQFIPPFYLNTRVYSCILIQNDIPYRWRGRYNEDTDLSLRVLKDGWCTVLFNAFLAKKISTMTMKGGNTDELYKNDGRLKMAESLQEQHPDVVKITRKWRRWQHQVDYRPFKRNRLIPKNKV